MKSIIFFLLVACFAFPKYTLAQHEAIHTIQTHTAQDLKDFFRYTSDRIPFVSAHRGGPAPGYPENCLETFQHTLTKTYAMLEVDPRYTKDGEMVLMHDPTINRTSNGQGQVNEHTLKELKQLKLKDQQQQLTTFAIPTLDEALQWAKGKTILVLDSKDIPGVERAKKIVANHAEGNAILIIYSYEDALKVYQYNPDILMEIVIADEMSLKKFEQSHVPFQNIIAFVSHQEPKDPHIMQLLHEKKVMAMRGTAFLYDKAYTEGKIDKASLLKNYQQMIKTGTDIIEADLGIEAGEAVAGMSNPKSSKYHYFQLVKPN